MPKSVLSISRHDVSSGPSSAPAHSSPGSLEPCPGLFTPTHPMGRGHQPTNSPLPSAPCADQSVSSSAEVCQGALQSYTSSWCTLTSPITGRCCVLPHRPQSPAQVGQHWHEHFCPGQVRNELFPVLIFTYPNIQSDAWAPHNTDSLPSQSGSKGNPHPWPCLHATTADTTPMGPLW